MKTTLFFKIIAIAALSATFFTGCDGDSAGGINITVTAGANGTVSVDNPETIIEAGQSKTINTSMGSMLTLSATPDTGFTFSGWTSASGLVASSENPFMYVATSDDTITASFETPKTVTLSASSSEAASGDTITVTLTPDFSRTSAIDLVMEFPSTGSADNLEKDQDYTVSGLGVNNEISLPAAADSVSFTITVESDVISDGKTIMAGLADGADFTAGDSLEIPVYSTAYLWTDISIHVGSVSFIAASRADDSATAGVDESAIILATGSASYSVPVANAFDTWTEPQEASLPANSNFGTVAVRVNANGSAKLAAGAYGGKLYHLEDSSTSDPWIETSAADASWTDIDIFADGFVAASTGESVVFAKDANFDGSTAWYTRGYLSGTEYNNLAAAADSTDPDRMVYLAGRNASGNVDTVQRLIINAAAPPESTNEQAVFDSEPLDNPDDIACSADGALLAMCAGASGSADYIYQSTDSGANFSRNINAGQKAWGAIAMSDDGTKVYAIAEGDSPSDGLYKSIDSGNSWSFEEGLEVSGTGWMIRCSTDGTILVAAQSEGYLYISTDSGETWILRH